MPSTDSGDDSEEDTPVPIPNTEVKLSCAEDTSLETSWKSRYSPDTYKDPELEA